MLGMPIDICHIKYKSKLIGSTALLLVRSLPTTITTTVAFTVAAKKNEIRYRKVIAHASSPSFPSIRCEEI